ncbi:MAG: RHS repeat-associated core domain-containing protein [Halothece sp.]
MACPYAQVLEEYVAGELEVRYAYGHDLISQEREGETAFYQVDGLGSTRVLTDETGGVVQTYTYDGFGELIESTGEEENSYQFAGEQYDEGLDQYYLRQRYYEPAIGRFTRRDTFEGIFGEPITLHKYLYANDNPVLYTDPTGLYAGIYAFVAPNLIIPTIVFTAGIVGTFAINTNDHVEELLEKANIYGGFLISTAEILAKNISLATTGEELDPSDIPDAPPETDSPPDSSGDWEWKGKPGEPVGGDKGAWVNKKTGEQWHPDLSHPEPIGPHWDYKDKQGKRWRVFPDGRKEPKS